MKRSISFFKFACRMFSRRVLMFSISFLIPCGSESSAVELAALDEWGGTRPPTSLEVGVLASGRFRKKWRDNDQSKYPAAAIKIAVLTTSRVKRRNFFCFFLEELTFFILSPGNRF